MRKLMRGLLFVMIPLISCGGPGSGTSATGDPVPPKPNCERNADCPQTTTPFCVDGFCQQYREIAPCEGWGDCAAGFHCEDGQCLTLCQAGRDCCPEGQDCSACDTADTCNEFKCLTDGSCLQTTALDDCTTCVAMDWLCLDTAPECYLEVQCNIPADCNGGQICIDHACTACEVDAQCPAGNVCLSGSCTEPGSPGEANNLCDADSDCNHIDGGFCSNKLSPRRCTMTCSNNGQCRSADFGSCEADECVGS